METELKKELRQLEEYVESHTPIYYYTFVTILLITLILMALITFNHFQDYKNTDKSIIILFIKSALVLIGLTLSLKVNSNMELKREIKREKRIRDSRKHLGLTK